MASNKLEFCLGLRDQGADHSVSGTVGGTARDETYLAVAGVLSGTPSPSGLDRGDTFRIRCCGTSWDNRRRRLLRENTIMYKEKKVI